MPGSDPATGGTVGVQMSLYPLRQPHLRPAIEAAVTAASQTGVECTVGKLSTFSATDTDRAFRALRAAFDAAASFGPTVMVATLSTGLPSDDTVAGIQRTARSS